MKNINIITDNISYGESEYSINYNLFAEHVDNNITYAEYIAEHVANNIDYAEYIAAHLAYNLYKEKEIKRKIRMKKLKRILNDDNEFFKIISKDNQLLME